MMSDIHPAPPKRKPRSRSKVPGMAMVLGNRPVIISHIAGQDVWVSFADHRGGSAKPQAKTTIRALRPDRGEVTR
jgi:hypothetical protein